MIEIHITVKDKFFKQVDISVLKEQPSLNTHTMCNDDKYNSYLGFKINEKRKKKKTSY